MPVRTRDWLKFGTLVAIAFVFGLAFASTLNLPKQSGAAETLAVPSPQAAPQYSAPALKAAGDFQDAFVAVAEHVKPSVVFIRSQHVERGDNQRLRSEEHTSELQSLAYLVCRLLLEKKKNLTQWNPTASESPFAGTRKRALLAHA